VPGAGWGSGYLWWFWHRQGRRARRALVVSSVLLAAVGLAGTGMAAVSLARGLLPGKAGNTAAVQSKQVQGLPPKTVVSLTFDDAYKNQWRYAVPLLRSHHMNATFYVITADSDGPYQCCMSWSQLRTLQGEGNDIGSHTIDHPNLTTLTAARITREVCGSRQDMLRNGIGDPESFAYPFGSYNATAERVVARCGFTIARQGGGISSSATTPGPPWAETLPPKHPEAVRTIAVDGASPIQLSDLENYVTEAAAHGGGWLPITFHDVCDAYAPDYVHCMSTYGPIQDTVLGQFLNWLHGAGHTGGAPAGVVVQTMRWAMNTVDRPDTTSPSTRALCDNSPCQAAAHHGPVSVSLRGADPGGVGVAKTYYTTDRSTPNTSSGVYQMPLLLKDSETIKFFSVDNAGNTEHVKTVTVKVGSPSNPGTSAAG
jgi:peptidoglycan/xylan/chitin deacetylase (PgdA/CDA1 family)